MSHAAGPGAVRLWLMLFCALFSVALAHGIEGSSTHSSHGDAHGGAAPVHEGHPHLFHHAAAAGTAGQAGESATAAALSGEPQPHRHAECLGVAAVFLLFLLLVCPPSPLGPVIVPRRKVPALLRWSARGSGARRPRRRLLAELSVLRV